MCLPFATLWWKKCPHLPVFPMCWLDTQAAFSSLFLIMEGVQHMVWNSFFCLNREVPWGSNWLFLSSNGILPGKAASWYFQHSRILPCFKRRWFQILLCVFFFPFPRMMSFYFVHSLPSCTQSLQLLLGNTSIRQALNFIETAPAGPTGE